MMGFLNGFYVFFLSSKQLTRKLKTVSADAEGKCLNRKQEKAHSNPLKR